MRYLRVFLPDSGFAIRASQRYACDAYQDAHVVATKRWKKGEWIEHLAGWIAAIPSDKESSFVRAGENDFR